MKNFFQSFVSLLLLAAGTVAATEHIEEQTTPVIRTPAGTLEAKYFDVRDGYFRRFADAKIADDHDEERALNELEEQLRNIIGPIHVRGFSGQGKSNLETLHHDPGIDNIDGLKIFTQLPGKSLFVTTDQLLANYLERHPIYPKQLNKLAAHSAFYSPVFDWDASFTTFADIPVKRNAGQSFARAYLGSFGQDIGRFPPRDIIVFVAQGRRVFLVSTFTESPVAEIGACKRRGDEIINKAEERLAAYPASKSKSTANIAASSRMFDYEEQAYEAYHDCYRTEASKRDFFVPLQRQVQAIVDSLH